MNDGDTEGLMKNKSGNQVNFMGKVVIFLKKNKKTILGVIFGLMNIIIFSIVLSDLNDNLQHLTGVANQQEKLLLKLIDDQNLISIKIYDSQKALERVDKLSISVAESINKTQTIVEDYRVYFNQTIIEFNGVKPVIDHLNEINIGSLNLMTSSINNVIPINQALSLYSRILNTEISSYNFNKTTCQAVIVEVGLWDSTQTFLSGECNYLKRCGGLMSRVIHDDGVNNILFYHNDSHLIKVTNGRVQYSVTLKENLPNVRYYILSTYDRITFVGNTFNLRALLSSSGMPLNITENEIPDCDEL